MLKNKNDQSKEFIKVNSLDSLKLTFSFFFGKTERIDCILSSMSLNVFT